MTGPVSLQVAKELSDNKVAIHASEFWLLPVTTL